MTISSVITNVSMSIGETVIKEAGTYLVETTAGGTKITDQDSGETFNVEPLDSVHSGLYRLFGDDGSEPRLLTLGSVQRENRTKDCGCRKPGMI